ncbi:MAG: Holliday junction resolvase RuvX [Chloroflexota bacterium]
MSKLSRRLRNKLEPPGKKLLGLDLGERRIGVALSDSAGILASPLLSIDLRHEQLSRIAEVAEEYEVDAVVVGLPVTLAGEEGFQAARVRRMASELEAMLQVPIVYWDERLTSATADQILGKQGRQTRNKGLRDAYAAAVLLQSYLDTLARLEQA